MEIPKNFEPKIQQKFQVSTTVEKSFKFSDMLG